MEKEQIAFIIKSGKENKQSLAAWINRARQQFEVSTYITEYAGHALTLTVEAIASGAGKIVAVGGDGTLNEIINAIIASGKTNTPVMFLPAGTANDWGKTMRPPSDPEMFVSRLLSEGKLVDIGKISWGSSDIHYFVNVADAGMGAQVVKEVKHMKWKLSADIKFLLAILKVFFRFKNESIECIIDGKMTYSGLARTVVIANGKYFGSGLCIAPDALPDDGKFEVVIIGDVSVIEYLKYVPSLRSGKFIHHPKVHYHKGREVLIHTRSFQTEADGELIHQGDMKFNIEEKSITML